MKKILVILSLWMGFSGIANSHTYFQMSASFGVFYTPLTQYGEWIESDFGYAWRPKHVMHSWRPYLYGRWLWTDYGWYWVSDEPFGWATYHYGRWNYDDYYGWIWIPDYEWGPSWVEWCYNDDYIGWAPLTTYAIFNFNFGITFSGGWVTPVHYWNFIPYRNFTSTRVVNYIIPQERNRRIYGETRRGDHIRTEDRRVINKGVDASVIEQRTNSRIKRVEIVNRDRGEGERLLNNAGRERIEAYRPQFENRQRDERNTSRDIRRDERRSNYEQRDRQSLPNNRDVLRERVPLERKPDANPSEQRNLQREQRQREMQQFNESSARRQGQMREQMERRQEDILMRQQQMRENRNREMPQYERPEPQIRKRQQPQQREFSQPSQRPSERRDEPHGGGDRRRRP